LTRVLSSSEGNGLIFGVSVPPAIHEVRGRESFRPKNWVVQGRIKHSGGSRKTVGGDKLN